MGVGSNCPKDTEQERGPAHTGLNKALKSRSYLSGGSYQAQEHMEEEEEDGVHIELNALCGMGI